jgi:hypothetical protein
MSHETLRRYQRHHAFGVSHPALALIDQSEGQGLSDLVGSGLAHQGRLAGRQERIKNASSGGESIVRSSYSHLSFALASAFVCHCILDGPSDPPRFREIT